jgi:hypothetical protein
MLGEHIYQTYYHECPEGKRNRMKGKYKKKKKNNTRERVLVY